MAQETDFNNQIGAGEIAQDKVIKASTITKLKDRDLELMEKLYNPSFSVYKSAGQLINSSQVVIWDSTDFDNGRTNEKFDLTNNRFIPQVAAEFYLEAQLTIGNTQTNHNLEIVLRKNGAIIRSCYFDPSQQSIGSDYVSPKLSGVFAANGSTDYFDIYCIGPAYDYTVLNTLRYSYFTGFRVVRI